MNKTYKHSNLEESEKTLNNILDIISDGIWDWNSLTGKVIRNPGWYRMLGYPIDNFNEDVYTWEDVIHHDDYEKVMKHFESYIKGEIKEYKIKYRCKKNDGNYLWIEDSGRIIEYTDKGEVVRMIGAHTDIHDEVQSTEQLKHQNELLLINNLTLENIVEKRTSELEELNHSLREQVEESEYHASFDMVTGIYNRRKFEEIFLKEISRAKRYSYPLSFILLDIDEFKKINDTYGHKTGDKVLFTLSEILKDIISDIDTLARWGGEEFVIVLPNTSKDNAFNKAEKIRQYIESHVSVSLKKITCSFGVTSYIENDDSDLIFKRADEALYLAKNSNRNNVKVL